METTQHPLDPVAGAAAEESPPVASVPRSRTTPSHGVASVVGRARTMIDAVKAVPLLEIGGFENQFDFFAVYGGGGAAACQAGMHLTVATEAESMRGSSSAAGEFCRGWEYWNRVMSSSFQEMEDEIRRAAEESDGRGGKSGRWTAVVVMVGKEEIVVADSNSIAGDFRAVLYRGGVALPLTRDDENRVKSGDLSNCKRRRRNRRIGFGCPRPHIKFRPIMKHIRSLSISTSSRLSRHLDRPNDQPAAAERKQGKDSTWNLNSDIVGIIGDRVRHCRVKPEVTVTERGELSSEEFVVIGSKGLWDVVSNELACDVVAKCFSGGMKMRFADDTTENCAAAFLAELAMARGSRNNVSAIVVKL
ncbi:unnamed protein product [Linum trigynum]|uniref:PPM-type phosphatase domain-containing protein n=1 Tax=Linum trigynum TaxID=586398 RepID=A0AAV2ELC8_9ROSI